MRARDPGRSAPPDRTRFLPARWHSRRQARRRIACLAQPLRDVHSVGNSETHLHMKERPPGSPVETPGPNEQEQRQREAAREWIRAVEEEFLGSDARLHELLGYVKGTTPEGESLRIEFEGAIRQLHRRLGRLYRDRLGISDEIWQEAIDS